MCLGFPESSAPAVPKFTLECRLGPQTLKKLIWHPKLVKVCGIGPKY